MAPAKSSAKKGKGASSSSRPTFPTPYNDYFVTEQGEARFSDLCSRSIIPQKGIGIKANHMEQYGEIQRTIVRQRWEKFCAHPEHPGYADIVREFYANYADMHNGSVFVRRKWIPFSREVVNAHFGCDNVEPSDDQFITLSTGDIDYPRIVDRICIPGASWVTNAVGSPIQIPKAPMSQIAKAWMYFVTSTILPVTHYTDLIKERALLLYAVMEGLRFDVGTVIMSNFRYVLSRKSTIGLGHPAMIWALCYNAGVRPRDRELKVKPGLMITGQTCKRFKASLEPDTPDDTEDIADADISMPQAGEEDATRFDDHRFDCLFHQNQHLLLWAQGQSRYQEEQVRAYNAYYQTQAASGQTPLVLPLPPPFPHYTHPIYPAAPQRSNDVPPPDPTSPWPSWEESYPTDSQPRSWPHDGPH